MRRRARLVCQTSFILRHQLRSLPRLLFTAAQAHTLDPTPFSASLCYEDLGITRKARQPAPLTQLKHRQSRFTTMGATSNVLLIIIGIFLPPVSVFLMTGCSCDLLINICLTVLGYFPGHIHCFW